MIPELKIGDTIVLRKVHPCGSYQWEVYRVGSDIGIRCAGCGRRVLMTRRILEKRAQEITSARPTLG